MSNLTFPIQIQVLQKVLCHWVLALWYCFHIFHQALYLYPGLGTQMLINKRDMSFWMVIVLKLINIHLRTEFTEWVSSFYISIYLFWCGYIFLHLWCMKANMFISAQMNQNKSWFIADCLKRLSFLYKHTKFQKVQAIPTKNLCTNFSWYYPPP